MLQIILFVSVCFVAFTNGANANFKGVASLYGSATTTLRTALWWGTLSTFAGSIAALFLAEGMIRSFSGRGLVSDSLAQSPIFTSAVAVGAAITSFLATRYGFPVSTTHALVGALVGAGYSAAGETVHLAALGKNFFYPLLFSPIIAFVLGGASYWILGSLQFASNVRSPFLDIAHFTSAGAASFARGLNDTPKIAALILVSTSISSRDAILLLGILIAIGALVDAKNVAETLGRRVTDMTPSQGFAANVVTTLLVTTASLHSLPVSTTHVSVGSLLGMGASTRQAKWKKVFEILLAWVITLPCAAAIASIAFHTITYIVANYR